jgi:hypothetical protein
MLVLWADFFDTLFQVTLIFIILNIVANILNNVK